MRAVSSFRRSTQLSGIAMIGTALSLATAAGIFAHGQEERPGPAGADGVRESQGVEQPERSVPKQAAAAQRKTERTTPRRSTSVQRLPEGVASGDARRVGAAAGAAVAQGGVEVLGYSNTIDPPEFFSNPGPETQGFFMADDIELEGGVVGDEGASMTGYEIRVFSAGAATYDVAIELWDNEPCGTQGDAAPVPGTQSTFLSVPPGSLIALTASFDPPVRIPPRVWMRVGFSDPDAGWIVAEEAEVGFSDDFFSANADTTGDNVPDTCDLFFFGGPPANPQASFWAVIRAGLGAEFISDEVIVRFLDGTPQNVVNGVLQELNLQLIQELPLSKALHVRILSGERVERVITQLVRHPSGAVEYAHLNEVFTIDDHLTEPNDPSYPSQWGVNNRGINPGIPLGIIDADIDAPQAWEHKTDCRSVIIAVLDTGADLTHPDLAGNLWTNPGEIAGNGLDDDGNGFIDDVNGWDFAAGDNDPTDVNGHGTNVAGIIGAVGNNGVNIAGVCWQAQLMIVRVLGPGAGWPAVENGINFAVNNGATVINMSLGAYMARRIASIVAIAAANANGALIVATAGNNGINNDAPPAGAPTFGNSRKPCAYQDQEPAWALGPFAIPLPPTPNIICVAASNYLDQASPAGQGNTNWGPVSVDLFAPGTNIITLRRAGLGGGTTPAPGVNGTSFAAPHVSGAAAHCWSLFPGDTHLQIKARLQAGVDSRPALNQARPAGGPTRVLWGLNNDGRLRMCQGDDFGDAPDPFTGPGLYPTLKRNPALGAGAQVGASHEDVGDEWLGDGPPFRSNRNNGDPPARLHTLEVSPEFDANQVVPLDADGAPPFAPNLVDNDQHDDGVTILGPILGIGLAVLNPCTDNHQVCDAEGGRYTGAASPGEGVPQRVRVPDKAIYITGFADWNQDGDWDDVIPPSEFLFSRRFVPPACTAGAGGAATCHGPLLQFFGAPFPLPEGDIWYRFRLDYGEDVRHGLAGNPPQVEVGHAGPPAALYETSATLNRTRGQAQFGEVEDYRQEIDFFAESRADVTIESPLGTETVTLTGPTTVAVNLSRLSEDPDTGLESVPTEIVQLDLSGESTLFGPITLRLRPDTSAPFERSVGRIEEKDNATPNLLDIPPFTATGAASSFFNVFFEVEVGGQLLHNNDPKRMEGQITHKPPRDGERYEDPIPIPLYDEDNLLTEVTITAARHIPRPKEIDSFPNSKAVVEITGPLGTETVTLTGPTTVEVDMGSLADTDGDGLEQVPTEIVQLELTGNSELFGPVAVRVRPETKAPFQRSLGEIQEQFNDTPGVLDLPPFTPAGSADSFFEVFFEIDVDGQLFHNKTPKQMRTKITEKPPAEGETYEDPVPIPLFDEDNLETEFSLTATRHTPRPSGVCCFSDPFKGTFCVEDVPAADCELKGGISEASCDQCPRFCERDDQCDDGDACTTDLCDRDTGTCSNVENPDIGPEECCDPDTGSIANRDDGNPCTIDQCSLGGNRGTPEHVPAPAGTACDDGNGCTVGDLCDETGVCVGNDVNGQPCVDDADCGDGGACILEECQCPSCDVTEPVEPGLPDDGVGMAHRTVPILPGNAGRQTALRVKFVNLPGAYSIWNDAELWVQGPVREVTETPNETDADPPTVLMALLGCTRDCRDWDSQAAGRPIHLVHEGILPSGDYEIVAEDCECPSTNESAAEPLETSKFGDMTGPQSGGVWPPPDGEARVAQDVLAGIDKLLGKTEPSKPRVDTIGFDDPQQCVDLRVLIGDVLKLIDGALGKPYPFSPTATDPCTSACTLP